MRTSENTALVTLFVKVKAKSGSISKAKSVLLSDVRGAWTESGNLKMELYSAEENPDTFYLFERWENQAALENHFVQPYTKGAFDLQNGDLDAPIEMNYLTELFPKNEKLQKEAHRPLTTLLVDFKTKPGNGAALQSLFKEFVPIVRNENGNVEFHFYKVNGNDERFVLYERWESQAALDAHNQSATTAKLVSAVSELIFGTVQQSVIFADDISNSK
ncbi:putative quinol monooxygenase [Flavobacterium sp.]|uniref:putative quinol monooxygenase n=1 Tax=Flavobacterium sp. TaxID=239 RepID=UPI00120BBC6D|nr:putative quinol monooxygenase [Flavobacterium sp.]RZJ72554.1 MAG: antibiotic biosynthesis monooxygenase [Flavobacterium sp.]